jgi:hypothetical protein
VRTSNPTNPIALLSVWEFSTSVICTWLLIMKKNLLAYTFHGHKCKNYKVHKQWRLNYWKMQLEFPVVRCLSSDFSVYQCLWIHFSMSILTYINNFSLCFGWEAMYSHTSWPFLSNKILHNKTWYKYSTICRYLVYKKSLIYIHGCT